MPEAHFVGLPLKKGEIFGRVHALDGQVIARGSKVLADGEDIHPASGKIAADLQQLVHVFAEADHDSGLGDRGGRKLLGRGEQVERALITRAAAGHPIEARHGLGVVVEDVGPGVEHDLQAVFDGPGSRG